MVHESAQTRKGTRSRFIGQVVSLHRGVILHPVDQLIQLLHLCIVVKDRRGQQITRQHGAQSMALRHIQSLHRGPCQIEPLRRDPGKRLVGCRWRAPERDEELLLCPTPGGGLTATLGRGAKGGHQKPEGKPGSTQDC